MEITVMGFVIRWAFISALALINVTVLIYIAALVYAKITVGPMMGRHAPSVSEELNLIVRTLSLWDSCFVGLIMLATTVIYWLVGLQRIPELRRDPKHYSLIKRSLLIVPLLFAVIYMVFRYVWFYYYSNYSAQ